MPPSALASLPQTPVVPHALAEGLVFAYPDLHVWDLYWLTHPQTPPKSASLTPLTHRFFGFSLPKRPRFIGIQASSPEEKVVTWSSETG